MAYLLRGTKRTYRGAISEIKAPSCDEITHLLKTAGETAGWPSASREVAHNEITHKLRVRYSKAITRTIAGNCIHAIILFLQ